MNQEKITERHLQEITLLCVGSYFSTWLMTENLWLSLAEEAIEKGLSVSKLKERVDQWKKVIVESGRRNQKRRLSGLI